MGVAVIVTRVLKELKIQSPNTDMHVFVAAEAAPLLENFPWITKVWLIPRSRGKANFFEKLPFIKVLRNQQFDQSIDFGGNDRGMVLSLLTCASFRLGANRSEKSKWLQRISYTKIVRQKYSNAPYLDLHFELLATYNFKRLNYLQLESPCNLANIKTIDKKLPKNSVICHITILQRKKDWPLSNWAKFHQLAHQAGLNLYFSAGNNALGRSLPIDLKMLPLNVHMIPLLSSLNLFLCNLKSSKMLRCCDTRALHFTEGLGLPTLGNFALGNSLRQVANIIHQEQPDCANYCSCDAKPINVDYCKSTESCMASIQPEIVF